jgi:hypothetical protein
MLRLPLGMAKMVEPSSQISKHPEHIGDPRGPSDRDRSIEWDRGDQAGCLQESNENEHADGGGQSRLYTWAILVPFFQISLRERI